MVDLGADEVEQMTPGNHDARSIDTLQFFCVHYSRIVLPFFLDAVVGVYRQSIVVLHYSKVQTRASYASIPLHMPPGPQQACQVSL